MTPVRHRRFKAPLYPGCKKGATGLGHVKIVWTCRDCGVEACALCAHHFGTSRSPVVFGAVSCERKFSCYGCVATSAARFAANKKK